MSVAEEIDSFFFYAFGPALWVTYNVCTNTISSTSGRDEIFAEFTV